MNTVQVFFPAQYSWAQIGAWLESRRLNDRLDLWWETYDGRLCAIVALG
jgi:hypothetical protein